jgi:hypothetical protein
MSQQLLVWSSVTIVPHITFRRCYLRCPIVEMYTQCPPLHTYTLLLHIYFGLSLGYEFQCFNQKGLHFIHLSARSLFNKIAELQLIANKSKAAIILVPETWLDDSITNTEKFVVSDIAY